MKFIFAPVPSKTLICFVVFLCLSLAFGATLAKPPDEEHKTRVIKNELSDEEHFDDDGHNAVYDHEAFLGEEQAHEFDQLSPEESQERLGKIVDKIDRDKDGFVTQEELKAWIQHTQKSYIFRDVQRQWESHNPKNKDKLSWDDYKSIVYGFMERMDPKELENEEEGVSYLQMLKRDQRRWDRADQDGDGQLSIEEFTNFLHPEESKHMRDIVVQETMEDVDKDKDGKLSMEEYIGDMFRNEDGSPEPSWVETEREQFQNYRDRNKDGYMDLDEVQDWIIPSEYDHAEAESKHLIQEADQDKDGRLTRREVLDNYDLFVGSQATDFGDALLRHDEF